MERVLDISKLKMTIGSVLIKVNLKKTNIVAPNEQQSKSMIDYAEVVSFTSDITDLEVGDIVIDFRTTEGFKWKGEQFAIIPRNNVKLVVSRDNINLKPFKKELKN